jgi:predicted permease
MLSDLLYRFRALFQRNTVETEMDDELRFHFEQSVNKYEESGLSREEALRRARLTFGGIEQTKEECRETRGVGFVETIIQDGRYSLRRLRRSPGFTAAAVMTLALGIGATTAIFSVVEGVLLKPLPYPHPEQLVAVWHTAPGWSVEALPASASTYFIYREQSRTFQDIGLYMTGKSVNIAGLGEPEYVSALRVTDGVLPILGVTPLLGRSFTRTDDSPGSADTIILTYEYWRRKFGGDRSVIGRAIDVDGKPRTIIGVLPRSFHFLNKTDSALLLPMKLNRAETCLGTFIYGEVARLKPGVTLTQANADVARMFAIEERSFPPPPGASLKLFEEIRIRPQVGPLKQTVVGNVGEVLWVLMGGISLVLIIACANLANLLLVRAEGRRQELTIRSALGAGRGRIAAQLWSETLTLGVFGGSLGLGLAYGALRVLTAVSPPGLPRLNEIGVDIAVVLFTSAVSLMTTLLIGSIPVLKYAGTSLGTRLREGGRSLSESRERHRSRSLLVIVQVALALVLLVSSGLMIRTFRALTRVHPGFVAPSEIQTFRVYIPGTQVKDPERVVRMLEEISHRIEALPGVSSVRFSRSVPMDGRIWNDAIFAKDRADSSKLLARQFEFVSPGFFKTLGTPLVAGRDFTWSDIYGKAPVAIVSQKLAREYWRDASDALGKQIRASENDDWREVVGVAGDVHQDGVDKESPPSVYWPVLMDRFEGSPDTEVQERNMAFAIRTPRAGSEGLMKEVRRVVWAVNPNLPLAEVHTLNDYYARSMARTSFTLVMLAVAGGMALLLGIVGLYGVIAYSVSQRRHEMGIRLALGAQTEQVLKMVVGGGFKLAALGVGLGIVAALGSTRYLAGLLYGVKPTDPLTFAAVSLLLIAVALLASYFPARQAAKVDPIAALRHE